MNIQQLEDLEVALVEQHSDYARVLGENHPICKKIEGRHTKVVKQLNENGIHALTMKEMENAPCLTIMK